MDSNDNNSLDFLDQKNNTEVFKEIDKEKEELHKQEIEQSENKDFIAELPNWDLLPPSEAVKRVVRHDIL